MSDIEACTINGLTEDQRDAFLANVFHGNVRAHHVWAVRSTAPDGQLSFKDCADEAAGREWITMFDGLAVDDDPHHKGRIHEVVSRPVVSGPWETSVEETPDDA